MAARLRAVMSALVTVPLDVPRYIGMQLINYGRVQAGLNNSYANLGY